MITYYHVFSISKAFAMHFTKMYNRCYLYYSYMTYIYIKVAKRAIAKTHGWSIKIMLHREFGILLDYFSIFKLFFFLLLMTRYFFQLRFFFLFIYSLIIIIYISIIVIMFFDKQVFLSSSLHNWLVSYFFYGEYS